MIGRTLGHYRILDRLGAGGMGEVWLAEDQKLGRKVALKMLRAELTSSREKRLRFAPEARAAAALNHPNIVTLHAFEEEEGVRFLVLEYVEGRSLLARVVPGGLPPSELLRIGAEIADALAAAHAAGIVHRDLKPGNILLGKDGRVKVVDFGLARAVHGDAGPLGPDSRQTSLTRDGLALGTLNYMSPEQLANRPADHRSDLFALGVVLFELATGDMPFAGESAAQLISSVMRDRARRIDERQTKLPPQIVDLVDSLLAKEPAERPASAAVVRDRLREAAKLLDAETSGVSAAIVRAAAAVRVPGPPVPERSGRGRRGLLLGAAAAAVLLLALALALRFRRADAAAGPAPAGGALPALAVLPLGNFSGDPQYFVDGMTDGLIGALARLDSIRVISRQSAMHYKGSKKRLPEIAAELGVDLLVEGSLRRDGGDYRVQVQLFRTDPEQQVWSGSFARPGRDLPTLHVDVARAVASALHVQLSPTAAERFETVKSVDPEAYDAYLRARHLVDQGRPETVRSAKGHFERALALDPSFAPAHAGLAEVYGFLALFFEDPVAHAGRQEAEARRALELDPGLAEAHALLGDNYRYFSWDWTGAEAAYRRALELGPNDARVRRMFWGLLASLGRLAEARREIETAIALDPLSAAAAGDLGYQGLFDRRWEEAERSFRRALELDPAFPYAHGGLWALYDLAGRDPERGEALRAWLAGVEERELLALHDALPAGTPHREALRQLGRAAEQLAERRRVTLGLGAALLAAAGELDAAEAWLLRAHRERDPELVWLAMDPAWEPLRKRPAIVRVLGEMRLPGGAP
jgi:TolB-like protein/Tfp pilus assembly protein PilF